MLASTRKEAVDLRADASIRPYNHPEVCNAPRREEDCPPYISGTLLIAL